MLEIARCLGHSISADSQLRIAAKYRVGAPSLDSLQQAASDLGVHLLAVKTSLDELAALNRPCIVRLQEPAEFAVLIGVCSASVQISRGRTVLVAPRDGLVARMTGEALVPDTPDTPHARLCLQEPDVYLGEFAIDHEIHHEFRFQNRGARELEVSAEPQECAACSSLTIEPPRLRPGEMGTIAAVFRTRQFGKTGVTLWIRTNDPLRRTAAVTMRAIVTEGSAVSPTTLAITTGRDEAASVAFRIRLPSGVALGKAHVDLPFLDATLRLEEQDDHGSVWAGEVACRRADQPGVWNGKLMVDRVPAANGPITVPVHLEIRPGLYCTPPALFLGFVKVGRTLRRELCILSRQGRPFAISEVRASGLPARTEAPESVSGGYRVAVAVDALAPGLLDGHLLIRTDAAAEEVVRIPITGWVE